MTGLEKYIEIMKVKYPRRGEQVVDLDVMGDIALTFLKEEQSQKPIADASLVNVAVDKFLAWALPKDFSPDGGISFTKNEVVWPTGTNLFTAPQAKQMFIDCLPSHESLFALCKRKGIKFATVRGNFSEINIWKEEKAVMAHLQELPDVEVKK